MLAMLFCAPRLLKPEANFLFCSCLVTPMKYTHKCLCYPVNKCQWKHYPAKHGGGEKSKGDKRQANPVRGWQWFVLFLPRDDWCRRSTNRYVHADRLARSNSYLAAAQLAQIHLRRFCMRHASTDHRTRSFTDEMSLKSLKYDIVIFHLFADVTSPCITRMQ